MAFAQTKKVRITSDARGDIIQVDNKDFFIKGMNWDYFPINTNYTFVLWNQPYDYIKVAVDTEMKLLKEMGVNAIRVHSEIPPKWITYIYEHFGIYTMLNHTFGRYGLTLDGNWVSSVDYSDPRVVTLLLEQIKELATLYNRTDGLLLYLLGNENNYGLHWKGAETENTPSHQGHMVEQAKDMYQLFDQAAKVLKSIDTSHVVALCNGDLQYLDIIAADCKSFDIFGTNMYRGLSFGDTFERVKKEYGKPLLFTEFGADAYNMKTQTEDQVHQSEILISNWHEIYQNGANLGKTGNCLGGFTFQFSDGWWKYNQTYFLEVHNTEASWSNGGYTHDYISDQNNMNEEWFGICAKGISDINGHITLKPRLAYFQLKKIHKLNPLKKCTTIKSINKFFEKLR